MKDADVVGSPSNQLPDQCPTKNDVARFLFFHIEDQRLKKNRDTDAVQTLVTELIIDHYKNTVSKSSAKSQIKGALKKLFEDVKRNRSKSKAAISGYRQKLSAEKFNVGDFDTDTSSARNENSNQPVEPEPLQRFRVLAAESGTAASLPVDTDQPGPAFQTVDLDQQPGPASHSVAASSTMNRYQGQSSSQQSTGSFAVPSILSNSASRLSADCRHAFLSDSASDTVQDSEDSWHPDLSDKRALDVHPLYEELGPVMIRHGISCAAMADMAKVIHRVIAVDKIPLTTLHRLPNEWDIRNSNNILRERAIEGLGQKQYEGLYFDGKEGTSLARIGRRNDFVREETYAIVGYPGYESLGSCLIKDKSGRGLASTIINYLERVKVDFRAIKVLGSDGTNAITGYEDGALRHMQDMIGYACFLSICLLHLCELPLRALLCRLDNVEPGVGQFNGKLGKLLQSPKFHERKIKGFTRIKCPEFPILDDSVVRELSQDNYLLYSFCVAATTGYVSKELAEAKIGVVNHARWLTFATRNLRLYMTAVKTDNPEVYYSCQTIAKFTVQAYYRQHAEIKKRPNIEHGSRHLFKFFQLLEEADLPKELKDLAKKKVHNNSYFAHPEAVIIAKLGHEDQVIRKEGVEDCKRILKLESEGKKTIRKVRLYKKPKFDETAKDFRKMFKEKIDATGWYFEEGVGSSGQKKRNLGFSRVTLPPILIGKTEEEIEQYLYKPLQTDFPCHQQGIERMVALMSKSKQDVVGELRKSAQQIIISKDRKQNPPKSKKRKFTT